MKGAKRKQGRPKGTFLYGEESVNMQINVPKSKLAEIRSFVKSLLERYKKL